MATRLQAASEHDDIAAWRGFAQTPIQRGVLNRQK